MKHEPLGLERDRAHGGGDVGVAIVKFCRPPARGRTDDRRGTAPDGFLERCDVTSMIRPTLPMSIFWPG